MYLFLAKKCTMPACYSSSWSSHIYNVDVEIKAVYKLRAVVLMSFQFPQEELWGHELSCCHLSSKLHEQAADY